MPEQWELSDEQIRTASIEGVRRAMQELRQVVGSGYEGIPPTTPAAFTGALAGERAVAHAARRVLLSWLDGKNLLNWEFEEVHEVLCAHDLGPQSDSERFVCARCGTVPNAAGVCPFCAESVLSQSDPEIVAAMREEKP